MSIKFEIVELYPLYGQINHKLVFSGHVYLFADSFSFDLRGYTVHYYYLDKSKCRVYPPFQRNWDYEDKKIVKFPAASSTDQKFIDEINDALLDTAKLKFKSFVFEKTFPKNYAAYTKLFKKKPEHREKEFTSKRKDQPIKSWSLRN